MNVVQPERLIWQEAKVNRVVDETPTVKSYFLSPKNWPGFTAGQHVDVRLTAPDGYQAQRSYSIGSAPESPEVELVIEKLDTGEVSPFFHDVVQTAPGVVAQEVDLPDLLTHYILHEMAGAERRGKDWIDFVTKGLRDGFLSAC